MKLKRYSIGIGDRFGCQGKALLKAIIKAEKNGIDLAVVWNKSFREHQITKTDPNYVLKEAVDAMKALNWNGDFYIDADHINLSNVDLFIKSCNYFTLDVAECIGKSVSKKEVKKSIQNYYSYIDEGIIPFPHESIYTKELEIDAIARKFLYTVKQTKKIYDKVKLNKGEGNFIIEISLDEAEINQTPFELFFILSALSHNKIPIQTIAPKFTGSFNKGVDYEGDLKHFTEQFEQILTALQIAKNNFNLPENLKLSIHSGSDKFSLYPIIKNLMKKYNTGVHLKTAGTTWLEELIGLASVGNDGLEIVKQIYQKAYYRFDELCSPYIKVVNINKSLLPHPKVIDTWNSEKLVTTLRHDLSPVDFNPNIRQFFHISYRIAAEMGSRYINALKKYEEIISENIIDNIYNKHIKSLFE
ncbi:MAG: tagaturonate epimerase family protein [Candidatus Thorarchaeota archaeon]